MLFYLCGCAGIGSICRTGSQAVFFEGCSVTTERYRGLSSSQALYHCCADTIIFQKYSLALSRLLSARTYVLPVLPSQPMLCLPCFKSTTCSIGEPVALILFLTLEPSRAPGIPCLRQARDVCARTARSRMRIDLVAESDTHIALLIMICPFAVPSPS